MENPNWTTIKLNPGERVDDLERCGFKIIQDPKMFCFGIDAVLLSGFAKVRQGDKVLDLCSGNGIVPILLAAKSQASHIFGIELQKESVDLAQRSVIANGIAERVRMICGDIKEVENYFVKSAFDVVTCNPPYMIDSHGLKNPDSPKALARHELTCNFDDVARIAADMLKPGGRFFLVHRPFRLVELFETLTKYKLEPKRMKMVHPFVDHEPNMVLIEAVAGGRSRLAVEAPLIVYEAPGQYTQEIYDIYGY